VREPLLVLDDELRVLAISQAFATFFALRPAEAKGQPLHELDGGAWRDPALRQHLTRLVSDPAASFDDLPLTASFAGSGRHELLLYGRCINSDGTPTGRLLLGVQDMR
jgi:two-component system CheB/CheR fusion protein